MIVCFQNIDGRRIYRVWTEDEYMFSDIRVDFTPYDDSLVQETCLVMNDLEDVLAVLEDHQETEEILDTVFLTPHEHYTFMGGTHPGAVRILKSDPQGYHIVRRNPYEDRDWVFEAYNSGNPNDIEFPNLIEAMKFIEGLDDCGIIY